MVLRLFLKLLIVIGHIVLLVIFLKLKIRRLQGITNLTLWWLLIWVIKYTLINKGCLIVNIKIYSLSLIIIGINIQALCLILLSYTLFLLKRVIIDIWLILIVSVICLRLRRSNRIIVEICLLIKLHIRNRRWRLFVMLINNNFILMLNLCLICSSIWSSLSIFDCLVS